MFVFNTKAKVRFYAVVSHVKYIKKTLLNKLKSKTNFYVLHLSLRKLCYLLRIYIYITLQKLYLIIQCKTSLKTNHKFYLL